MTDASAEALDAEALAAATEAAAHATRMQTRWEGRGRDRAGPGG